MPSGSVCSGWPQTLPALLPKELPDEDRSCYAALLFAFGCTGGVGMLIVRVISSSDIL